MFLLCWKTLLLLLLLLLLWKFVFRIIWVKVQTSWIWIEIIRIFYLIRNMDIAIKEEISKWFFPVIDALRIVYNLCLYRYGIDYHSRHDLLKTRAFKKNMNNAFIFSYFENEIFLSRKEIRLVSKINESF